ncbi:hypothetical protein BABINDRAFT_39767 [Babjeviella inositovora NRRL Y-12698]|uniref:Mitochondrial zinc maintenance protein 1, mitochondrial n=1 Tax=Babjeviella inositovora NRRL Y-12698 TaxID=984486 RepID=A0A1E3QKP8_9ASCO|nr:uncharacterized protein BABINDRAFT_39767 [Babjeviella inositovora NRRL Y-12698]ODQ78276.1 hypothetical protein BABINDRAFT_39767 [Babjeviella inositovora NRRL Y-12698]
MDPRVRQLYKSLLWMGRDYPYSRRQGIKYFRTKLHRAFMSQSHLQHELDIIRALHRGEYVIKELEALYFLSRYRAVKRSYYD